MGLTLFGVGVVYGYGVYASHQPDPSNWLETVIVSPEAHKSPICVHMYTKILTVLTLCLLAFFGLIFSVVIIFKTIGFSKNFFLDAERCMVDVP